MQPTDAANVVSRATSDGGWAAGLVAVVLLLLVGLVGFHYRAMWAFIQRMSLENQDVVDDNTLAWLQVARAFSEMPCLFESDVDEVLRKTGVKPEEFGPLESHVRRVMDRRERRKAMREKNQM